MKRIVQPWRAHLAGLAAAAVTVLASAGCATTPAQSLPRFPHQTHLADVGANCLTCHRSVLSSTESGVANLPAYSVCARCHGQEAGPGAKFSYNAAATFAGAAGRNHIVFAHKNHMPRAKGQCVKCHVDVQTDKPTAGILPNMASCLESCHQRDYDTNACTRCHEAADLPKLRPVSDIPHGVDYVPRHATDATRAQRLCQTCHQDSWCTSCHENSGGLRADLQRLNDVQSEFSHRGDYITRHPIEASENASKCLKCHTVSSCDACHVRNHVSGNGIGGVNHHPPGWVGDPGGETFHGRAARRHIVECASCHEQGPATNCIRCHKVGAYGGNPHPSGWKSSQSNSSAEMCQYCHAR